MESNLTPEYIHFVKKGHQVNSLVQQVIDRAQYLPGFLADLNALLNKYEDPFEEVELEVASDIAQDTATTGTLTERRLRPEYCK